MAKQFECAVVGATGLVGREIINLLSERGFPVAKLKALDSQENRGETVQFGEEELPTETASAAALAGAKIVFMAAGAEMSAELAPAAAKAGAVVIDYSSRWRLDDGVPLVVPEVNPKDLARHNERGIVANPSCATIQMAVALNPLHQRAALKRVVVSTYQAVSDSGKPGLDELGEQVTALFGQLNFTPKVFPKRIAFNCVPQLGELGEDGWASQEHAMELEARKILNAPELGVCATCVRVPVFNGHAESLVAQFERPLTASEARDLLREAPGILLMDDPGAGVYPTQVDAEGSDATLVGRIRADLSAPNSLALWCVADNLRKGAASNAVQIAELLARDYL